MTLYSDIYRLHLLKKIVRKVKNKETNYDADIPKNVLSKENDLLREAKCVRRPPDGARISNKRANSLRYFCCTIVTGIK